MNTYFITYLNIIQFQFADSKYQTYFKKFLKERFAIETYNKEIKLFIINND